MGIFNTIPAVLVLADGTIFEGSSLGALGEGYGEVVFNTSMTGYQEILTDPSYAFQMITFTSPHIGNVGTNDHDMESDRVFASGVIVKEACLEPSNYRSEKSFDAFLKEYGVVGISGIDTRALVLHLRENGSQMGIIASGDVDLESLKNKAAELKGMEGRDLVSEVTCKSSYLWDEGTYKELDSVQIVNNSVSKDSPHVVAIDYGVKRNILRLLVDSGFTVTVVPATISAQQIRELKPDAIFLSNGPGDPAAVSYAVETVRELLGETPIFGICLGHQIMGLAVGIKTFKLKFGHRGGNHPVRDLITEKVEISVQNHGFASIADEVPDGVKITHLNLNDGTIEGLALSDKKAFSVQHHPESSPGPHDSQYHFNRFKELVTGLTSES